MASREVDRAVGEATTREKVRKAVDVLIEKRAALSAAHARHAEAKKNFNELAMADELRLISGLTVLIVELEREAAREREQEGIERAKARLVGIRRAFGSLTSELDEDEKRVIEAIGELQTAMTRLNERYAKASSLKSEAEALSDRFGLDRVNLPSLVPPVRREFVRTLGTLDRALLDHPSIYQPVEDCEHRLRTRRTYRELPSESEAFKIIESVGLKPFPELTERQQAIVSDRERTGEEMRRQHAALPRIPSQGSTPVGSI
jgi:hypothetical protein